MKNFLIRTSLAVTLVLATTCLHAQVKSESNIYVTKFYDSVKKDFFSSVTAIDKLATGNNCIPVLCLLKITVDQDAQLADLAISDSADPALKAEFAEKKSKIDIVQIEEYARTMGLNNKSIIVPVSYKQGTCVLPPVNAEEAAKATKFNGEAVKSDAVFLEALTVSGKGG